MNNPEDQVHFKNEVKKWLRSHDLSYKWMGQQCGVSEVTVRNWMSQKAIPARKVDLIKKVMLEVPVDNRVSSLSKDGCISINTYVSLNVTLNPESFRRLESKAMELNKSVDQMVSEAILGMIYKD